MSQLRWIVDAENLSAQNCYGSKLGVHPLVGQMLVNRGINNIPEAYNFLNPNLRDLHDPMLMHDMQRAVLRIREAILKGEKIAVFGDYDVDGVTASATMFHALTYFGVSPRMYIPHRLNEGYGISPQAIETLAAEGVKLIISVDCGVTAVEPAAKAHELGVDLVVTDHHQWKDELPKCYAIVHPRLDNKYPNPELCGAGVAHKVAWALGKAMEGSERVAPAYGELLQQLLAFTALGTIADVVPLIGENRVIAHHGLKRLPESVFKGLRALIVSAGLDGADIDGYHVGFCLAPRLNAAGRLGHALTALKMLTTDTWEEALETGKYLEQENKARQDTERAIVKEAKAQAEAEFPGATALVLTGKDWHSGVVGIVASRVIDERYCPTIVLVDSGDELHGSCRSIEGFNLYDALKACEHHLIRWGGHAMAAGIKLKAENLDAFRSELQAYVTEHCPPELLQRRLLIDAWATIDQLTEKLIDDMNKLGPFGQANRKVMLALKDAVIVESRAIGKEGKHLSLMISQKGRKIKAIAFGRGDDAHLVPTDTRVDIAAEPTINEWRGRRNVELLVRDIVVRG
jgi:single-stranded-DNA-specific exonuclease